MNPTPPVREPRLPIHDLTLEASCGTMEPLSRREMDVLVSLADEGQSNTVIGDELFISEKTVRTHLVHIMEKVGASTRTQVVLQAQRLGLLLEPDSMSATARVLLAFIHANQDAYRELLTADCLVIYEVTP